MNRIDKRLRIAADLLRSSLPAGYGVIIVTRKIDGAEEDPRSYYASNIPLAVATQILSEIVGAVMVNTSEYHIARRN
jgi:hypothetical protein